MPEPKLHIPVMCEEIIKYLRPEKDKTILDCTVGSGGHAEVILKEIGPGGRLVGIDRDPEALNVTKNRLSEQSNCIFIQDNFRNIDTILANLSIDKVDGIIFDLGVSSLQMDEASRGFSLKLDAPLDMRMDRNLRFSAFDLVNFLPEVNLSDILKKYGEERWHNRIARAIVRERKKSLIVSTRQLAELIKVALPYKYSKIHPATRVFQALRIAVNDELEALREGLNKAVDLIRPGARICVISFHSLEDRIVKMQLRKFAQIDKLKIITKKPIVPTREEILKNPRSRSAKLRVAEGSKTR